MRHVPDVHFIGIAGPTGAGKTTVCANLKKHSRHIEHIRMDTYFKLPNTFPMKGKFRNWEKASNLRFDLLAKHLTQLRRGKTVRFMPLANRRGAYGGPITIQPKKFVLIEGFLLFKDPTIRKMLDVRIFFDLPPRLMLARRMLRFGGSDMVEYDLHVAIPEFLKHGQVQKKYADYVIDASKSKKQVLKRLRLILLVSS